MTSPDPGPLLSSRAALLILLAVLAGLAAAALTMLSGAPWTHAVLVGCTAGAGSLMFFNRVIGA